MIEFTKGDLVKLTNIMGALKRGKYDLEGDEVLALAQSFAWISQLADRIKADLDAPKADVTSESPKKAKK